MRFKFIDPQQIFSVIIALIVLGVGVFACGIVLSSVPAPTPVSSAARMGNGTISNIGTGITTNATYRWIPTPGFLNNTAVCILWQHPIAGAAGGYTGWQANQTVGACNGTFCANGTYRVPYKTWKWRNDSVRLEYALAGQQTTTLQNMTYNGVINISGTSTQVFNIIGVVMIIAAIMSIIAVIYQYIKPKG